MSVVFEMPEDFSGSNFLDKPGTYHVMVTGVDENPVNREQRLIDGIQVSFQVLDGTEASQKNRIHNEMIFNPKAESKDGGKMARLKIGRLIRALQLTDVATGQLAENMRGQPVTIDWQSARGKQMVIRMEHGQDPRYMQLAGVHVYKVTDGEVASVPKSAKALAVLGVAQQAVPAAATMVTQGLAAPVAQVPVAQQPVAAAAAPMPWDDLLE